jgi:hypothetical protein
MNLIYLFWHSDEALVDLGKKNATSGRINPHDTFWYPLLKVNSNKLPRRLLE